MATVEDFMRLQRPIDPRVDARPVQDALSNALSNIQLQTSYAGLTPENVQASAGNTMETLTRQQAMLDNARQMAAQQDSQRFQEAMQAQQAVIAERQLALQAAAQAMQARQHAATLGLQQARFQFEKDQMANQQAAMRAFFQQLSGQPAAAPAPLESALSFVQTANGITPSPKPTSQQGGVPNVSAEIFAALPSSMQNSLVKNMTKQPTTESVAAQKFQLQQDLAAPNQLAKLGIVPQQQALLGGPSQISYELREALAKNVLNYKQFNTMSADLPLDEGIAAKLAFDTVKAYFNLTDPKQITDIMNYMFPADILYNISGGGTMPAAAIQPSVATPTGQAYQQQGNSYKDRMNRKPNKKVE